MTDGWRVTLPRTVARWLPVAGVVSFVAAYCYAAARYPGGSRLDHHTVGYHHLANYWCDVLDGVTYSGAPNPGRPVALAATIAFPLSLIPLWWTLPQRFDSHVTLRRVVRAGGVVTMGASTLIFTSLHDRAIHLASAVGLVTLLALVVALWRTGRGDLSQGGLIAASLGVANYALWASGSGGALLPGTQKLAYAAFLIWVLQLSHVATQEDAQLPGFSDPPDA